MSRTKMVFAFAGAAMGLSATALAQTSNLDSNRAYQADLLSDASTRTSTLAAQPGATVNTGGQLQFRYVLSDQDDDSLSEETTLGFQARRTKVWFWGSIAEGWDYKVVLSADRDGGSVFLEDAFVTHALSDNASVQWGQFKLPFGREESMDSKNQLAAERSVTNYAFSQGRSQGIQYNYTGDSFRFMGAFSDGFATANSDFTSAAEADWGVTARGEYMWAGTWDRFEDFTSWRGSDYAGMFGFAGNYQSGGDTFATVDMDMWNLTADVSMEGDGWNAFAYGFYRTVDMAGPGSDLDDWGFGLQAGVFVSDDWELFGRWGFIAPDSDYGTGLDEDFNEFTVGVNHYVLPESHAAKFTADVSYYPDTVASSSIVPTGTGTGLLGSTADSEWVLRLQFQLLF